MAELQTAIEVIDALGGPSKAARLAGRRWASHGSNWKAAGRLPPDTFLIFTEELKRQGHSARPEIWGIAEAGSAA